MNPFLEISRQYDTEEKQDQQRRQRNAEQIARLRREQRISVDRILAGEETDTRYCCSVVTRPPLEIRRVVQSVQKRLGGVIWPVPPTWLHMTLLELAVARPLNEEFRRIVRATTPLAGEMAETVKTAGVRLHSPLVNVDSNALALSFVSCTPSHLDLRSRMCELAGTHGIVPAPRYVTASAHVTIGRFVRELAAEEVEAMVETVEAINRELGEVEWILEGCEINAGLCWYGVPNDPRMYCIVKHNVT